MGGLLGAGGGGGGGGNPLFLRLCPLLISDFICSCLPTPSTDTSSCTITPGLTDVYFLLPVCCFVIANLATVSRFTGAQLFKASLA